jgi:hypothetical protein
MSEELLSVESQIAALQQKAAEMRTTINDPNLPAVWRKLERDIQKYRYLPLSAKQGELFRRDGWEPLYRRQERMAELRARELAKEHKGVALVRATETHHGIH